MHGVVNAEGRIRDGGRQLQSTVSAAVERESPDVSEWHALGDVIVASEQEVYLNVKEYASDPPHPLFSSPMLVAMQNTWWKLPQGQTALPSAQGVTPDPVLLRMQVDVVEVTRDRGMTTIDGTDAYHYDVSMHPDKLRHFLEEVARQRGQEGDPDAWKRLSDATNAHGELWIEAKTFFLRRVRWTLEAGDAAKPLTVHLDVRLSDINQADPIIPPAGARELPLNPLESAQALLEDVVDPTSPISAPFNP